jgi:hypothetical protein
MTRSARSSTSPRNPPQVPRHDHARATAGHTLAVVAGFARTRLWIGNLPLMNMESFQLESWLLDVSERTPPPRPPTVLPHARALA